MVVKALNSPNPYEKSVVVNGKTIQHEINGTKNYCSIPDDSVGTWIHGHPDSYGKGKTLSFSGLDFQAFMAIGKLKGAILYNSAGEITAMRKKSNIGVFQKLITKIIPDEKYQQIKTNARIGAANSGYNSAILKNVEQKTKLNLNKLVVQIKIAQAKGDIKTTTKLENELSKLYNQELEKATQQESVAIAIHKFWTNYAKYLGVEYASNFSNFK